MVRLTLVVAALIGLAAAGGCSPTPPCGLRVCDIREPSCQQDVTRATACLRGQAAVDVPIRVIKQADYVALVEKENAGFDPEHHRRWMEAYGFFGLGDPQVSIADSARTQALWVAAYYLPGDRSITIVDAGRPLASPQAVSLLVHETMHALQEQHVGFEAFNKRANAVDLDRILSAKAITEGEASLVEDLSAVGLFGADEDDVRWGEVFAGWQGYARRAAVTTKLPVSLAWGHFPYPFGTEYVHAAYERQGFSGIDALYQEPPVATVQVLARLGTPEPRGQAWSEELGADTLPVLPEPQYKLLGYDRLGAWVLDVFLNRIDPQGVLRRSSLSRRAPLELRADAFSFFSDASSGETVSCWRLRFSSADVAAAVQQVMVDAGLQNLNAWLVGRDLVVLASRRQEIRALGGPQLAFKALPPPMTAASMSAAPRCIRRLEP